MTDKENKKPLMYSDLPQWLVQSVYENSWTDEDGFIHISYETDCRDDEDEDSWNWGDEYERELKFVTNGKWS